MPEPIVRNPVIFLELFVAIERKSRPDTQEGFRLLDRFAALGPDPGVLDGSLQGSRTGFNSKAALYPGFVQGGLGLVVVHFVRPRTIDDIDDKLTEILRSVFQK